MVYSTKWWYGRQRPFLGANYHYHTHDNHDNHSSSSHHSNGHGNDNDNGNGYAISCKDNKITARTLALLSTRSRCSNTNGNMSMSMGMGMLNRMIYTIYMIALVMVCVISHHNEMTMVMGQCSSCAVGQYYLNNVCTNCPIGYYCPSTCDTSATPCAIGTANNGVSRTTTCDACPTGYYTLSQASTICTACPAGSYCSSTTVTQCTAGTYSSGVKASCSDCASGTYSNAGASYCAMCPKGYSCEVPTSSPVACAAGYISQGGIVITCSLCNGTRPSTNKDYCISCPINYECSTGTAASCAAGTYSLGGTVVACSSCPAGYSCAGTSQPVVCTSGTYSYGGAGATCTSCPVGYSCLDPSQPPALCDTGYYSLGSTAGCTICAAGNQCPTTTTAGTSCASGTYSLSGATSCITCPAGYSCATNNKLPIRCQNGYNATAGSTSCSQCAAGYQCATADVQTPCATGYYSYAGSIVCEPCPAGYQCPTPATSPIACTAGTYSTALSTSCTTCPAGSACPFTNDNIQIVCAAGTYSLSGSTSCTACAAGYACSSTTAATAVACSSGTYSTGSQSSCTPCPAGYACPLTTAAANTTCTPGTYSIGSQSTCTVCAAGSACPNTWDATTTTCTGGTYSIAGQSSCTVCPAGYACTSTTSAPTAANLCTIGTYALAGSQTCTACPAGFACPNIQKLDLVTCPTGTYANGSRPSCLICEAGYQCPDTTARIRCAAGTYALLGSTSCTTCPGGYVCADGTAAVQCPIGYYLAAGSTATTCTQCPAGTFCRAGTADPTLAENLCPRGYWCGLATTDPTACPAGYYNPNTGGTSQASACISCGAGYSCGIATQTLAGASCPPGYYCGAGTQTACAAGTYNPYFGAVYSTDCIQCPAGRTCGQASTNANTLCANGFYCPAGTIAPCATGTYTSPCPQGCAAGTYGGGQVGLSLQAQCSTCPTGSWCPIASTQPTLCTPGTYNPSSGSSLIGACTSCLAGMACPTSGLIWPSQNCSAGHYCPSGTIFPSDYPCAAGTYTDSYSLTRASDCTPCPAGFTCGVGTGGVNAPIPCPAGQYCATGSSTLVPYYCPAGYYSNRTNLDNAYGCLDCPIGYYCTLGATQATGTCQAGYYCPLRSTSPTGNACAAGTYSTNTTLSRADQCTACPIGYYCLSASTSPTPCPVGTYGNLTYTTNAGPGAWPGCVTCPAGYTCATTAMTSPTPCGKGRYSVAGSSVVNCTSCAVGFYCDLTATTQSDMVNRACPAGMYCPAGQDYAPTLDLNACPAGYYCTQNTPVPVACSNGTYNPSTGAKSQGNCLSCPAGHYCLSGSISITGDCSSGYYCAENSSTPITTPCPAKTYRRFTKGESLSACSTCPAGYYCPDIATVSPTICPQGSFCLTGVDTPSPCLIGSFGNTTGLRRASECTACTAGHYCDTQGLTAPSGLCYAGYYCTGSANSPTAVDQSYAGGKCPVGGYCLNGSSQATPCPSGTFSNVSGLADPNSCTSCPPGYYCSGSSASSATGLCDPGYYCSGGASTSIQHICDIGTYSGVGAYRCNGCNVGTYNPQVGQSSCPSCPAGFYCANTSMSAYVDCPAGYYCDIGTSLPAKCPKGTYSTAKNLRNVTECLACPPGEYCPVDGGASSAGDCSAGYYCIGSAQSATPTDGVTGNICPRGYYCQSPSYQPTPCGIGTYNPDLGSISSAACLPCSVGHYCNDTGLAQPSGVCAPGYYCIASAISYTPTTGVTGGICPTGMYCPAGTGVALNCGASTYTNLPGQSSCLICPAGYYCPANSTAIECPAGSYCITGSNNTASYCPMGTYGNVTRLTSINFCVDCPPGQYCGSQGLTRPSGYCSAGYICASRSTTQYGDIGSGAVNCPAGSYCSIGSGEATSCPMGRFSSSLNAPDLSSCTLCTPGHYCNTTGATTESGVCAAGYYCTRGATTPTPSIVDTTGGVCPKGFRCPIGTSDPIGCAAGYYNSFVGQSQCSDCPAGYYCLANSTSFVSTPCPAGYYCLINTAVPTATPCTAGYYRSTTGASLASECIACPLKYFCQGTGVSTPTGLCSAGYYCNGGAATSTQNQCPSGSYCPAGSSSPISCPPGQYCSGAMQSQPTGYCSAGYYCSGGATSSQPSSGLCPAGSYCVFGSQSPTSCPVGTFSAATGNANLTYCTPCTAGYYCNNTGMTAGNVNQCTSTYYCSAGTIVPTTLCTSGHYCPNGTDVPIGCDAGYYQDQTGKSSCKSCPSGYYCGGIGNSNYTICPAGSYCPGTTTSGTQYLCPVGTYSIINGLSSASQCANCTPGYYCSSAGITTPSGDCTAGYYCISAASIATPTDGITGNICPEGAYCPARSTTPIACPLGFLAPGVGHTNSSACLSCPRGQYCDASATFPPPYCTAGYLCTGGAISPTPTGVGGQVCDPGYYCPSGTLNQIKCLPGTYNPNYGAGQCLTCPAGSLCASSGMITLVPCPLGYYCEGNNSVATGCPIGTFGSHIGLTSWDECASCTPGSYCSGTNQTGVTGACSAGYICAAGSSIPNPSGVYPSSGPCPAGYYCLIGATAPTPCAPGSYLSVTGGVNQSSCTTCIAGQYCDSPGLTSPSGNCFAGFYCPSGSITNSSQSCTTGHYCPSGSASPIGCADGYYQPDIGHSSCLPCVAGYYCQSSASSGTICPLGHYCPSGTGAPPFCMNGTYGITTGASSSLECATCPPGVYCQNGIIAGPCAAGYLCVSNNWSPTPTFTSAVNGFVSGVGGLCPPGGYCLQGATNITSCSAGTVREYPGGRNQSDCGPCPAGRVCIGTTIPELCPTGYYCPFATSPIACGLGTYGPYRGGENDTACIVCPAGYWCHYIALGSYTQYPCPLGYFCSGGILQPQLCAAGTFRATTGAATMNDCTPCPGGYYCTLGSNTTTPCPDRMYCPAGAAEPSYCPAGAYCGPLSSVATPCPAGNYCPINSSIPIPCPQGYYCPAAADEPLLCPLGSKYNPSTSSRTSIDDSCIYCPPGTHGADPYRLTCPTCTPGYVCLGATTSATPTSVIYEHGYQCVKGVYCLNGSIEAVPCPIGTYGSQAAAPDASYCISCPSGSFASSTGSAACTPCGSSAWSLAGSAQCTCNGTNRAFQESDGSCRCKPNYVYYDPVTKLATDVDSSQDCEPMVYSNCDDGYLFNALGQCVSTSVTLCSSACNSTGTETGTWSSELGICLCSYVPPEVLCGTDCLQQQPVLSVFEGALAISFPYQNTIQRLTLDNIDGYYGTLTCESLTTSCQVVSVAMTSTGGKALLGLPASLASLITIPDLNTNVTTYATSSYTMHDGDGSFVEMMTTNGEPIYSLSNTRHLLARQSGDVDIDGNGNSGNSKAFRTQVINSSDPNYDSVLQLLAIGYSNPTMCLLAGEGLIFDLQETGHYPVYMKDSLLNTNADFDYGDFRALATRLQLNVTSTSFFGFTFTTAGTYVFADAADTTKQMLVVVLPSSQSCPSTYKVLPSGADYLTTLGVRFASVVRKTPDLTTVWQMVGCFGGAVVLLAAFSSLKQYRLRAPLETTTKVTSGVTAREYHDLMMELQHQPMRQQQMFDDQQETFQWEIQRLNSEIEQLKALLAIKLADDKMFADAALALMDQESIARSMYMDRQLEREQRTIDSFQRLSVALSSGSHDSSSIRSLTDDAVRQVDTTVTDFVRELARRSDTSKASFIPERTRNDLERHTKSESKMELAVISKLKTFQEESGPFLDQCKNEDTFYEEKLADMKRRRLPGREAQEVRHRDRLRAISERFRGVIDPLIESLREPHARLQEKRVTNQEMVDQWVEKLEEEAKAVETARRKGIFENLDREGIDEPLRSFMLQLLGLLPARPLGNGAPGGMTGMGMGMSMGMSGIGMDGATDTNGMPVSSSNGYGAISDDTNTGGHGHGHGVVMPPSHESKLEDEHRAAVEKLNRQQEELAKELLAAQRDHDETIRLLGDAKAKKDMLEKMYDEDAADRMDLGRRLLADRDGDDELHQQEQIVEEFNRRLREMEAEQRAALKELEEKQDRDGKEKLSAAMADMERSRREQDNAREALQKQLEERMSKVVNKSEETQILAEHEIQITQLQDAKARADREQRQRLQEIQEENRKKLATARREMEDMYQRGVTERRQQLEAQRKKLVETKQARQPKIGDIDLGAIVAGVHGADAKENRKLVAQQKIHDARLTEIEREFEERLKSEQEQIARDTEAKSKEIDAEHEKAARETKEAIEREAKQREMNGERKEAIDKWRHGEEKRALEAARQRAQEKANLLKIIQARKAKNAERNHNQKNEATEREALAQSEGRRKLQSEQLRKREEIELKKLLTSENRDKGKAIIEAMMRPRQEDEVHDALSHNFQEVKLESNVRAERVLADIAARRDEVAARKQRGEITADEAKAENDRLDVQLQNDLLRVKVNVRDELKPIHDKKLKELRMAHQNQVRDMFKRVWPDEDFTKPIWLADEFDPEALQRDIEQKKAEAQAEVARKLAEIEEFKVRELERIAAEAKEQKERADALIEQKQRELQAQMEAHLAKFQAEADAAMERDRDAAHRRMASSAADDEAKAAIELRLEADRSAAAAKQKEEYERLRAKLHRQQQEKMAAFESEKRADEAKARLQNLQIREAEEKRQKEAVAEELRAKRAALEAAVTEASKRFWRSGRIVRGRRHAAIPLVLKKLKLIYRARSRAIPPPMMNQFQNVAQAIQHGNANGDTNSSVNAMAMATMIITPPGAATGSIMVTGANGIGIGNGVAAFPSGQTFMSKLNDIERMLLQMKKKNVPDGQFNSSPPPYIDTRERTLESKVVDGGIQPLPLTRLSPPQLILYRFGVFILDLLCHALHEPPMNLLVASSLPPKSLSIYDDNAFKYSFDIDGSTRTIFIHVDRIDSVGELTLLLVHIFAHMRAREWSDTHPRFTEEFFAALRHVCAELFFARSRRGHLGLGTTNTATPNHDPLAVGILPLSSTSPSPVHDGWGMNELRHLFGAVDDLPFREDVINEVFDLDIRRDGHDDFFSPDRLWQRLDGYRVFAHSSDLRGRLRGMEDTIAHSVARHSAAYRRQYASSYSADEQARIDERWERKMRGDGDAKRDHRTAVRAKLDEWADQCDALHAQLFTVAESCTGLHDILQRTGDDGRVNGQGIALSPAELSIKRQKLKRQRSIRDSLQARIAELERKSADVARAVGVDDPLASTRATTTSTTTATPSTLTSSSTSISTPGGNGHRASNAGLTSSGSGSALLAAAVNGNGNGSGNASFRSSLGSAR